MNLEFPTQVPFPLSPTRPTEDDRAGPSAFLEAISDVLNRLSEQDTAPSLDAAGFCLNDNDQLGRRLSADFTQEAITAVIRNIALPTKNECVWDPVRYCWVLRVIPI